MLAEDNKPRGRGNLFPDPARPIKSSSSSLVVSLQPPSTSHLLTMSQPNETLYIKNLNDKVNKEELRSQLYALFTTYGKVIDIVAMKTEKMRGQAFLVFADLASATAALRACEGIVFYDKPMVRQPSHGPSSGSR